MISAGRKFWLAVGFVLACYLLRIFNGLSEENFVEVSKWALGGYLGANVLHYAVEQGAGVLKTRDGTTNGTED